MDTAMGGAESSSGAVLVRSAPADSTIARSACFCRWWPRSDAVIGLSAMSDQCIAPPRPEWGAHPDRPDLPGPAASTVGAVAELFADVSPLRHSRNFRRSVAARRSRASAASSPWWRVAYQAFHLTHSTLVVGMIGFTHLVPLLAGALWGGTLADAWDRKRVLTLTQWPWPRPWPAWPSTPPSTIPRCGSCSSARRPPPGSRGWTGRPGGPPCPCWWPTTTSHAAVTLQTTTMALAMVVGPAIGGILIAALGLSTVYLIDVASFGVSLIAVSSSPAWCRRVAALRWDLGRWPRGSAI